MTCSIPGCENRATRRGWCGKHYSRWHVHGDPLFVMNGKGMPIEERLVRQSERIGRCLRWTGTTIRGYGYIAIDGKFRLVHRVAYVLASGPIPTGLTIDHVCHNRDMNCAGGYTCLHRSCIEPGHLEAVTLKENRRRAIEARHLRQWLAPDTGSLS